ncbi:MAG: RNA polymerase subunit sigma-24 [Bacteroidia bacterium]|nr:MAG: RNA polymerase subunit sigma-24 [Bacteroidia bacterium]
MHKKAIANKIIKNSEPTDAECILAAQTGDDRAFGMLVSRYQKKVAKVVFGMLGNIDTAEDIGQEVFIRFYKSLDSFRGEAQLGTYLTRIAINLSLNEIKRRKRRNFFSFSAKNDKADIEFSEAVDENRAGDIKDLVNHALKKLNPDFRSVVILRLIEGYSTKETADILKLKTGTVLSRLARAQEKLKVILKNMAFLFLFLHILNLFC